MCGLAGFIDNNRSRSSESLEALSHKMCSTLINRGPDDFGSWVDVKSGIAMSHRRLAIQDTTLAGHQPMASKSGRYIIVYNVDKPKEIVGVCNNDGTLININNKKMNYYKSLIIKNEKK